MLHSFAVLPTSPLSGRSPTLASRALLYRRFLLIALVAGLATATAMATARPKSNPDWPDVGRFDKKGRYHSPHRKMNWQKLYKNAPVPRYPVILVHGLGGFNKVTIGKVAYAHYFNGVARHLKKDGIVTHTTSSDSFSSIDERAHQLKAQLDALGYDKVNLICHSMGGLDARHLITNLGYADKIASITTVATPHHGSWYADWVLEWVFEKQRFWYVWDRLGIPRGAIPELTVKFLENEFNPNTPDMPQVRYFSIGGSQGSLRTNILWKGSRLIIKILEKRVAGQKLSLVERGLEMAVVPSALRRRIAARGPKALGIDFGTDGAWIRKAVAGRNDSKVSVSSAMWGEYLGTLDADHWDSVGWFGTFQAPRFYRGIAHMLADAGL
jgi:pimeloyl-ACP methyl ester carboxylesterase